MGALFPRWTNTAYRLALAALVCTPLGGLVGLMLYMRTPWLTAQYDAVDQPVQFDHRHHVEDDQIDCLYCHRSAEVSDFAGVPTTEVCMGCHGQIYNESPLLETVRRSFFSGRPIPWNRVHDLPDFTYFNHAVHVQRGVGCVSCHGRVDQMARVYKVAPMNMGWCLDCHANPDAFVGPAAPPGVDQPVLLGATLAGVAPDQQIGPHKVDALTTCSACHR
jgi:hypothetical protein